MKKLLVLFAIVAAITGCRKEVIEGPQGPQGPQGPDGNATVFSFIYDANADDWTTTDNGITWTTSLQVPEITQSVISNGAVMIYRLYDNNDIEPVPTYYNSDKTNIAAVIRTGTVFIYYESTNGIALNNPGNTLSFKVVVLQGDAKTGYQPAANEKEIPVAIKRD